MRTLCICNGMGGQSGHNWVGETSRFWWNAMHLSSWVGVRVDDGHGIEAKRRRGKDAGVRCIKRSKYWIPSFIHAQILRCGKQVEDVNHDTLAPQRLSASAPWLMSKGGDYRQRKEKPI